MYIKLLTVENNQAVMVYKNELHKVYGTCASSNHPVKNLTTIIQVHTCKYCH